MTRTLVRGGLLFDVERDLAAGDILIEDGRLREVGGVVEAPDAMVIDARDCLVLPGLVNAHTHSNQAIEGGLCDALPLDPWMVVASYGGAGARLKPEDLYTSAMVGALQMLRTGTTSVIDCARSDLEWFGDGIDAIMQAYIDVGMRASVAAQYSDLDFFASIPLGLIGEDRKPRPPRAAPDEVLDVVEDFVVRWRDRHPRVEPMLGPSSLPRCSIPLFEASVELAKKHEVRLQTHLLSAKSQVPIARDRYGGSTVDFLSKIGCLEPWTSYAHGIWVDDEEIRMLGESDAVVVHNPVSNLKLGAGLAPIPAMLDAGVAVALGSDGASSNDGQNMWETTKMAALLHRISTGWGRWPGAYDALRMCWQGGSAALGHPVGRLEQGYAADLTVLSLDERHPSPKDQMAYQLVYAELGRSVRHVLVDGELVLQDGHVTTVDEESIRDQARELTARIWDGLPEREKGYATFAPMLERLDRAVADLDLGFTRNCSGA